MLRNGIPVDFINEMGEQVKNKTNKAAQILALQSAQLKEQGIKNPSVAGQA